MQTSFWEQDAMSAADFIVVGAGLIGLQLALQLKQRAPGACVMVLERGVLPQGASSRNAGFACFGSLTEILADIRSMGPEAALSLVAQRRDGLAQLLHLLGEEAIGYEHAGGRELILHKDQAMLQQIDFVNDELRALFNAPVFSVLEDGVQRAGFGPQVHSVLVNRFEGQLHSGLAMRALRAKASSLGVEILNGVQVSRLVEEDKGVVLEAVSGPRFFTRQVAVCTNACIPQLMPELLPGLGIEPARGQVLVTSPIAGLPWRGAYHLEEGYYYFRNVGERVLLGGARHLAFEAERTLDMSTTEPVQQALQSMLEQTILPGREFRIESRWAGTMGFSRDKKPIVHRSGERKLAVFGCNGMGVALSPVLAGQAADLLLA